jgi:uncharacterized RDD family membrane protein YckC
MFCSKCGANVAEGSAFCPNCGAPVAVVGAPAAPPAPPTPPDTPAAPSYASPQYAPPAAPSYVPPPPPTVAYAGFWLRFVAFIIDFIILAVVGGIVTLPFLPYHDFRSIFLGHGPVTPGELFPALGSMLRVSLIRDVLHWLYYSIMESSAWQATIGKKALGLYVTDMTGHRISFGRATGRFFGKIVSAIILLIGFIMAGFTEKKQALHDMMAGCLVLRKL